MYRWRGLENSCAPKGCLRRFGTQYVLKKYDQQKKSIAISNIPISTTKKIDLQKYVDALEGRSICLDTSNSKKDEQQGSATHQRHISIIILIYLQLGLPAPKPPGADGKRKYSH